MAIKQQPRELHPNVLKIISIDRLNLSVPRARKLPAAQVAQLKEIIRGTTVPEGPYSRARADELKEQTFDRAALARRRLPYERLDQLVVELLMGI